MCSEGSDGPTTESPSTLSPFDLQIPFPTGDAVHPTFKRRVAFTNVEPSYTYILGEHTSPRFLSPGRLVGRCPCVFSSSTELPLASNVILSLLWICFRSLLYFGDTPLVSCRTFYVFVSTCLPFWGTLVRRWWGRDLCTGIIARRGGRFCTSDEGWENLGPTEVPSGIVILHHPNHSVLKVLSEISQR